jgi:predicted TIM-barrel fold metal-dependent hydrolase
MTEHLDPTRGQVIISADGHAGADILDYKPYLEKKYHAEFDVWAEAYSDPWGQLAGASEDENIGFASFDVPVNWDSELRAALLDSIGVSAEVLFPNTAPPFLPSGAVSAPAPRTAWEYEYRGAGVRAHNRWMGDFCKGQPGRRAGFAQIFLNDIDAAVAEVRAAKENGLKGILLPSDHILSLQNLYNPSLDPLWAACEELELPIHRHQVFPSETIEEGGPAAPWIGMLEVPFMSKRAIAHLLCSGVFERFPGLKFVITELSESVSLNAYLADLDDWYAVGLGDSAPGTRGSFVAPGAQALSKKPSEYFRSNCWVAGPLDSNRANLAGVPNLMFGADVPHSEGPGKHTPEAVRAIAADMDGFEVDAFLARRAAEVYGFDLDYLQGVADRIAPTRAEVRTPLEAAEWPSYPDESRCFVFAGANQFRD